MRNVITINILIFTNIAIYSNQSIFFRSINDTLIKVFINEFGEVTNISNAQFYRIYSISDNLINLNGKIIDYYLSDKIAFKSNLKNGKLHDSAFYYYESGKLKEFGKYQNGYRIDDWKYYYENGQLKKTILIQKDKIKILNLYNEKGKTLIENGKGKYKGTCIMNFDPPQKVSIKGEVLNGNMTGKWLMNYYNYKDITGERHEFIYNVTEKYENGNMSSGYHDIKFTLMNYKREPLFGLTNTNKTHDTPLIQLLDYNIHEHVNIYKTIIEIDKNLYKSNFDKEFKNELDQFLISNKISEMIYFQNTKLTTPFYKGKQNININFLVDLQSEIQKLERNLPKDFILLIEFDINKDGSVDNINTFKSKDFPIDQDNKIQEIIHRLSNNNWIPAKNNETNKTYDCHILIPIICNNKKIKICQYNLGLQELSKELINMIKN